jgi:hypothetical protein
MQEVLNSGYMLKRIIVKKALKKPGKRNQQEHWRYRALVEVFIEELNMNLMHFKKINQRTNALIQP